MSDPYTSHSTGKLKLKGVKDSKVSKKKKSSSSHKPKQSDSTDATAPNDAEKDTSVVLQHLADEDAQITRPHTQAGGEQRQEQEPREDGEENGDGEVRKTEAERRWDEQRRRRLEERLRREGVKSHKERVQELNRYLSGLSEHHDMPKIGPG